MADCPVCEGQRWREVFKINRWTIEECASCGFAKIDPMPAQEGRQEFYSEETIVKRKPKQLSFFQKLSRVFKRASNKALRRGKGEIFYNKLSGYLLPGAKILDVGCGDGSFLAYASKRFVCSGIEISRYLADLAKKKEGLAIKTGNFLEADFGGEKFDGITLISLLEHLSDPLRTLQKCSDLLNDKGLLLLKTVNYACANRKIKKENWTGLRPPDHVVYFGPANLKLLLMKAGFKKIKVSSWTFNDNMYCVAWKTK
jgi:2-polyprenyl-3-methyl-5-hydroxy-6-metoxy-1,4-benzoquinol methylase